MHSQQTIWNRRLAALFLAITLTLVAFVPAAGQVSTLKVINHVFAQTVRQDSQGRFSAPEILFGFHQGAASFETLTHVLLDSGSYQFEMRLFDPSGRLLEQRQLQPVVAQRNGWVQALVAQWSNVQFQQTGEHRLVLYESGRAVATFYLLIS